jgi:DNA-binding transcriptional ArsR family regulator
MISYALSVEDLADARFAISPLHETVLSLRVLCDPGQHALNLPWRRTVLGRLGGLDTGLLMSLVGDRHALPDFLTPRPDGFTATFHDELAIVRRTPAHDVRRDLLAFNVEAELPARLGDTPLDAICDELERLWQVAIEPFWLDMRQLLEADITYRARRLATGGARLLFADLHPSVSWSDGVLSIDKMLGSWRAEAAGRGLLLMPSVFAHKPAPPVSADEPPMLSYPCRGVAMLWSTPPPADPTALVSLLGSTRVRLLSLLGDPLATLDLARRLRVTPSAVSQHLRVLHATGLVTSARDGRRVLYRRSALGDDLYDPYAVIM